ncbi:2Fe-2S iron-sulfur cluster binding domain-containing protein [bacterium]|nr:MAG: 2Fe-2S iron-sulfur cluster binding domain-containing protein [bacterium]
MAKTVTVTIDGVKVEAPEGELMIEAAKRIGHHVPNFCYYPKLEPAGLCRMCLIRIEGQPKLQLGCNTRVTDGMVIDTISEAVETGRRAQVEFLLLNHPLDCPVCDKGGECVLQDYAMAYGDVASRSGMPKMNKPKAVDLGPTIVLDEQRCVLCQRCVRFDNEITWERNLVTASRGVYTIIATEGDQPYDSYFSGNTTELCPVGALTSKTYRFKARPWDVTPTLTVCTQCPVGCSTFADSRFDVLQRTRYDHETIDPHGDPAGDWICDRVRYNISYLTDERRLNTPMVRSGEDQWVDLAWSDAIDLAASTLKDAAEHFGPQAIGAIGGGRLTNQEAYLLQHVVRGLGSANVDYRLHDELTATPGRLAAQVHDLDDASLIIELGTNSVELAPVFDLRVRYAVERRGATLVHLGDVKPNWPVHFRHFPTEGDAASMLNEAAENVRRGEDLPKRAGEPPAQTLARLLRGAERVVVIWDGRGASEAAAIERLIGLLRDADKGAGVIVVGYAANARGAESMGMHPALQPGYRPAPQAGLDTEGMLRASASGELKALLIFGANPLLAYPNGALVRAALERVPFIVTTELFMTQTAVKSHVVLPVKAAFEKTGSTTTMDGEVKQLAISCAPQAGEPLTDREVLALLGDAMGLQMPSDSELEQLAAAAAAPELARAFSFTSPVLARTVRPAATPAQGAFTVHSVPRLYAGGGTSAHDTAFEPLRPHPTAYLHPGDVEELGLEDGDTVTVRNGLGAVDGLTVVTSKKVARGSIGVIAELPEAPVNVLADDCGSVHADVVLIRKGRQALNLAGAQGE